MNPNLAKLQPYPFEKLRKLTSTVTPADLSPIAWSIGEPKHAAPDFLRETLLEHMSGYSNYPATAGSPELKEAIERWIQKRFLKNTPSALTGAKNVLPVTGTREALFVVQALFDPTKANNQV